MGYPWEEVSTDTPPETDCAQGRAFFEEMQRRFGPHTAPWMKPVAWSDISADQQRYYQDMVEFAKGL